MTQQPHVDTLAADDFEEEMMTQTDAHQKSLIAALYDMRKTKLFTDVVIKTKVSRPMPTQHTISLIAFRLFLLLHIMVLVGYTSMTSSTIYTSVYCDKTERMAFTFHHIE